MKNLVRARTRGRFSGKEAFSAMEVDLANLKMDPETLEADFFRVPEPPTMERSVMRIMQRFPVIALAQHRLPSISSVVASPQNLESRIEKMRAIMRDYTLSAKERSQRVRNLTILAEKDFVEAIGASDRQKDDVVALKQVNDRADRASRGTHSRKDSCVASGSFSKLPTITEEETEVCKVLKQSRTKIGSNEGLHMKPRISRLPKPSSRIRTRRDTVSAVVRVTKEEKGWEHTGFPSMEAKLASLDAFFDVKLDPC
ncbi:hypothetical protein CB0940_04866 [Cercospora beticola]|uniref:Uncharacterized protein n=2 Tax=Cercospora beticola TaxID=122368 RepID=A0A2G5HKR2_CERBT|nr:hypothetical protein CB0940_04866 [Cercospora beticola]PIA93129.1 hypothetical protein CB0940_04866 [Cercospora beticola]